MTRPPRLPRQLLGRLLRAADRELFLADVDDAFAEQAATLGGEAARRWYWGQLLRSAAPLIRHRITTPAPHSSTASGDPMWRELLDDLRFSVRLTGRNRVATAAVIGTMILGIGVTTAVFSVVNGVLLTPLPFPGSERVVQFGMTLRSGTHTTRMAYPDMRDYARDTRSFEGFALATLDGMTLTQGEIPEQLLVARVSDGYAPLFGIRPTVGRFFTSEDYRPSARSSCCRTGSGARTSRAIPAS